MTRQPCCPGEPGCGERVATALGTPALSDSALSHNALDAGPGTLPASMLLSLARPQGATWKSAWLAKASCAGMVKHARPAVEQQTLSVASWQAPTHCPGSCRHPLTSVRLTVGRLQTERPPLGDIVIIWGLPIMSFQKKHESAILPFRVRFAFGLRQMFAGIGSTRKLVTSHHARDHDMTMRIVQHRPQG